MVMVTKSLQRQGNLSAKNRSEGQRWNNRVLSRPLRLQRFRLKPLKPWMTVVKTKEMLTELPDWITARWNKRVIESEEETETFPGLSQFVDYVAKEAKIACNPVVLALWSLLMAKRWRHQRLKNVGAKVLASGSEEKTDAAVWVVRDKSNHSIHTCQKLTEKPIAEYDKYTQTKKKLVFWMFEARTPLQELWEEGRVSGTHVRGTIQ